MAPGALWFAGVMLASAAPLWVWLRLLGLLLLWLPWWLLWWRGREYC